MGRKWLAGQEVEAEEYLHHADIVGTAAQGRQGLGCWTRASWMWGNLRDWRGMVQREVFKAEV